MDLIDHCQFFVKRKKRYCRMTVKMGNKYCGEHLEASGIPEQDNNSTTKSRRMPCPLDKSHTCYESRLEQHLKVCNVKRSIETTPAYIVDGINKGDVNSEIPKHIPLSNLDQDIVDDIIRKVEKAYDLLPKVDELTYKHEILDDEINNPTYGNSVKKHLIQNSSLLSHLLHAGLAKENTCFIEFGAGKGKLTYWLAQIIKDLKNSTVLLIDRSSHRHKKDNKLRNEQCPINVVRIKADIADLDLSKVEDVKNSKHKVGIAKHLCGSATDLMIRCLGHLDKTDSSKSIIGIIIAFCCHHRCEYSSYVGKNYLKECSFTANEFPTLCSIASWATCGTGKNRQELNTMNHSPELSHLEEELNDVSQLGRRESIGQKVKLLLNWGRVKYLMKMKFNCTLYFYTKPEVSPENMCVIATREIVN